MRRWPHPVTWLGILAVAGPSAFAQPGGARAILRCQTNVARAAERVVDRRLHALAGCLDAPADACTAALGRATGSIARLARAAKPCLGQPADLTLGPDGIGWEALAPVCPEAAIASLGDAVACLERTLPCAADAAMAGAVPEAVPLLAARGVVIDGSCLSSTTCGDGALDPNEECDDGPENSDVLPDHCRTTCLDPYCGDGVVDPDEAEECEPPGTATCDEDCFAVDESAALAAATAAKPSCERTLAMAAARVARKVQRQVDGCALAIARCSLVDDDPPERCLARAEGRCRTAAARRAAIPTRLAGRLGTACREATATSATRLARAACAAEAAVSRSIPRADELMLTELLDVDGDEAFPCVVDLTEIE